jgi:phenylpyruvate tautomerase PptA (4-oxalocrotonate tautomerase family)
LKNLIYWIILLLELLLYSASMVGSFSYATVALWESDHGVIAVIIAYIGLRHWLIGLQTLRDLAFGNRYQRAKQAYETALTIPGVTRAERERLEKLMHEAKEDVGERGH